MDERDLEQRDDTAPADAAEQPTAAVEPVAAPTDPAGDDPPAAGPSSRRERRKRRRVQLLIGAGVVVLLLAVAGAAVLFLRDDGGADSASGAGVARERRRAATTTTTADAATTTTTAAAAPGAAPGTPAAGDPAAEDEPVTTTIPIEQGGAVVSLHPGSCRWDPDYEVLTAAGTLTNRSGDVAAIEVTVVWKDAAGNDLEEGWTMETLDHGEVTEWEAEMPFFPDEDQPPPTAVSCVVAVA